MIKKLLIELELEDGTILKTEPSIEVLELYDGVDSTDETLLATANSINMLINKASESVDSIGIGQKWYDLKSERKLDEEYVNDTGKSIQVIIYLGKRVVHNANLDFHFFLDGVDIRCDEGRNYATNPDESSSRITIIIPPGSKYKATSTDCSIYTWGELR